MHDQGDNSIFEESEKTISIKPKKEKRKKVEEPVPYTPGAHNNLAISKMQLISALSASCSNSVLLEAFNKIPFGEQMLEIFAEAVEKKIQNMFSANIEKQQVDTKAIADEIYQKMKAVNESPAMQILRTLADGIVEGGVKTVCKSCAQSTH